MSKAGPLLNRRSYVTIVSKLFAMGDLIEDLGHAPELDGAAIKILIRAVEDLIELTDDHIQRCGSLWGPEMNSDETQGQTGNVREQLEALEQSMVRLVPGESTRDEAWQQVRQSYATCRDIFDTRGRNHHHISLVLLNT